MVVGVVGGVVEVEMAVGEAVLGSVGTGRLVSTSADIVKQSEPQVDK